MKTRLGFVSNSSSSSFVIVGVPTKSISNEQVVALARACYPENAEDITSYDDAYETLHDGWKNGFVMIRPSEGRDDEYFGKQLYQSDEYSVSTVSMGKVRAMADDVAEVLAQVKISEEILIIGGMQYN